MEESLLHSLLQDFLAAAVLLHLTSRKIKFLILPKLIIADSKMAKNVGGNGDTEN